MPSPYYSGLCPERLAASLCQRLAFEHACQQLYEALIAKYLLTVPLNFTMLTAWPSRLAAPKGFQYLPLATLRQIRDDKLDFFDLIASAITTFRVQGVHFDHADRNTGAVADAVDAVNDPQATLPASLALVIVAESLDDMGLQQLLDWLAETEQITLYHVFSRAIARKAQQRELLTLWLKQMPADLPSVELPDLY